MENRHVLLKNGTFPPYVPRTTYYKRAAAAAAAMVQLMNINMDSTRLPSSPILEP